MRETGQGALPGILCPALERVREAHLREVASIQRKRDRAVARADRAARRAVLAAEDRLRSAVLGVLETQAPSSHRVRQQRGAPSGRSRAQQPSA